MSKCNHSEVFSCPDCSPALQYAKITAPMDTMLEAHKHGYDCGFEDGFAEAVRMLKTAYGVKPSVGYHPDKDDYAYWLQKQRTKE